MDVHDGMLMIGTMMTLPARLRASMRGMSRCIAIMELYSVPWLPETNATVGPGRTPRMTATGMSSAESDPAGTAITPVAVVPRCADAVPTVRADDCCCWALAARAQTTEERSANRREIIGQRVEARGQSVEGRGLERGRATAAPSAHSIFPLCALATTLCPFGPNPAD